MKSAMRQNPCVFAIGCPRSGTTLLQRMLDRHPQLAITNDTHFIPRALKKYDPSTYEAVLRDGDVPLTDELAESVRTYHRLYRLGLTDEEIRQAAHSVDTYRDLIAELFDRVAAHQSKKFAGDKTPDYVRHIPLLHALFPSSKFVHIIRDGRDVCLSMLDWAEKKGRGPARLSMWQNDRLATAALWWRWQVNTGRADGRSICPNQYYEIRYEDLIENSQEELAKILRFLELPYTDQLLFELTASDRHEPADDRRVSQAPQRGLRDWRSQMTKDDQQLVSALAGDLLEDLDYDAGIRSTSPSITSRLEASRIAWMNLRQSNS